MTIYQNRDFFELFNQVRANFKSVALKVDEKIVERYKAKFAEVAKTPASPNEVLTEAESLGEKIRQVVAKVQNDIDAKTALKSNELKFPLYLGTINAIDVADLNELEGEAIALEVPVLEKSAAKLAEIQSQVEAQLEKLRPNAEANPGEKDKQDKDKDKGQDNGSKGQDQNNGIKEQDRNNGSKEKEQDKADKKRVIEERTKVADQVATTSGNSWVGKVLGGIGAAVVTLVGAGCCHGRFIYRRWHHHILGAGVPSSLRRRGGGGAPGVVARGHQRCHHRVSRNAAPAHADGQCPDPGSRAEAGTSPGRDTRGEAMEGRGLGHHCTTSHQGLA